MSKVLKAKLERLAVRARPSAKAIPHADPALDQRQASGVRVVR